MARTDTQKLERHRKPRRPEKDEDDPSPRPAIKSAELVLWEPGQLGVNVTLYDGSETMLRLIIDGDHDALMARLRDVAPWNGSSEH